MGFVSFSDGPTLGSIAKDAHIFVGHNSRYIDVYEVATDRDFSHTLKENIMNRGAMDVLISDNAKAKTSHTVQDILQMYKHCACSSEPHHPHQNHAACCIGYIKDLAYRVLTITSSYSNDYMPSKNA